jgi:hypothetical protein
MQTQEILVFILFAGALFFLGFRYFKKLKNKKVCSSCEIVKKD